MSTLDSHHTGGTGPRVPAAFQLMGRMCGSSAAVISATDSPGFGKSRQRFASGFLGRYM